MTRSLSSVSIYIAHAHNTVPSFCQTFFWLDRYITETSQVKQFIAYWKYFIGRKLTLLLAYFQFQYSFLLRRNDQS